MKTKRRRAGFRRLSPRARRRRIAQHRRARDQIRRGQKKSHGLVLFGAVVTVLYVFGVPWLYFGNFDVAHWLVEIRALQLIAYGGLLAASVGPLALLWLTLAVIKQGQELRLQAAQLAKMMEQSKQLVEVARRSSMHGTD